MENKILFPSCTHQEFIVEGFLYNGVEYIFDTPLVIRSKKLDERDINNQING